MDPLTELSLFSGGGGGLLASQYFLDWRTVCYVEKEKNATRNLIAKIKQGLLHDAPIWDNVRTFKGKPWRGAVDIISAGFPCQGYSNAGRRLGAEDRRNEWPSTLRIIREVRAPWVWLENVTALLGYEYAWTIFGQLTQAGYDCRWKVVSAHDVGAPHLRERLWIVANAVGGGRRIENNVESVQKKRIGRLSARCSTWETEPPMGRVADGLARGMGRALELLGEGQVPHTMAEAWLGMVYEEKAEVE